VARGARGSRGRRPAAGLGGNDKAVVEIPAPHSGHIATLGAAEGDRIAVGAVLVTFTAAAQADTGAVVGELPRAPAPPPCHRHGTPNPSSTCARRRRRGAWRTSCRCELESITGSGPDGVISVADVQRAAEAAGAPPAAGWESLHGARRAMAERMSAAHRAVVPASVTLRARIGAWHGRDRPLLRLIRALPARLRGGTRAQLLVRRRTRGRAAPRCREPRPRVDTAEGLFVPVIAATARLDDAALLATVRALREAVAARSIAPAQLRRRHDHAVELRHDRRRDRADGGRAAAGRDTGRRAHRARGRRARRPAAVEPVLPLSLTFDHRAVTGGEAARFLEAVRAHLEQETCA